MGRVHMDASKIGPPEMAGFYYASLPCYPNIMDEFELPLWDIGDPDKAYERYVNGELGYDEYERICIWAGVEPLPEIW